MNLRTAFLSCALLTAACSPFASGVVAGAAVSEASAQHREDRALLKRAGLELDCRQTVEFTEVQVWTVEGARREIRGVQGCGQKAWFGSTDTGWVRVNPLTRSWWTKADSEGHQGNL